MHEVNEHIVRFSGTSNLADGLEMDSDVMFVIKGAVVKTEDKSNQDGTVDRIYTVKMTEVLLPKEDDEM